MKTAADYSSVERDFARELSLITRSRGVDYKDVKRLAHQIVRQGGGLAMDQREDGPDARTALDQVERALQSLETFILKAITDEVQRERGLQLARALMTASATAGRAGARLGAQDRRPMAHDARSTLDRILAGRAPPSTSLTGR
jgi:hypothetical protein